MGILVACLTTGKGTWNKVSEIIDSAEWKKIFLITNDFGKEKFSHKKQLNFIIIDLEDSIDIMRDKIINGLKDLIKEVGFNDVAINFSSGSGKEHMAILSALIKLGSGIRIIDSQDKKLINV